MPGTLGQNGVAERRNRTLKDMDANLKNLDTLKLPPTHNEEPILIHEVEQQQPQLKVPLRRSIKERRTTIPDDYIVYLQEHEFDMGLEDDPISFSQVKQSVKSHKWIEAMKDEMKSMKDNDVWDLVELSKGAKPIGCKWIYKTKFLSLGAKKSKRQPRPVELGVDRFTSCWSINREEEATG
ncbi:hypothetical protein CK203_006345 [Vitis vinifera]|uniref:Retrovirus-related Pol polyprotein from transposon TNT 1-94 n=1 Tax=Vitis vinifera TaxID=29760 RepID=A0A438KBK8_VITVI|nr:hypothetical protein CK203_006345 [Vitis vinifera]